MSLTTAAEVIALQSSVSDDDRRALMALVRSAFFAGYDAARTCAKEDAATGMNWLDVNDARTACAGLWLTAEALPLLDVDVGCGLDPIYAPSESR